MRKPPIEQRVLTLLYLGGDIHNFFFSGGSVGSIRHWLADGWTVVHIQREGEMGSQYEKIAVLFEREKVARDDAS